MIDAIINSIGINDSRIKPVPAKISLRLHAFKDEPTFDLNFNYRSVVGKLNYLAQTTRPDIMYAVHQIVKYSSDSHQSHGEATLYLVHYLKKTRELGIHFKPDPKKGFECYCDADFSGLWNKAFLQWTPVLPIRKVDGSSSMQDALSHGLPNFNPRLRSLLQKPSTLPCLSPFVTSFLSWGYYRK